MRKHTEAGGAAGGTGKTAGPASLRHVATGGGVRTGRRTYPRFSDTMQPCVSSDGECAEMEAMIGARSYLRLSDFLVGGKGK